MMTGIFLTLARMASKRTAPRVPEPEEVDQGRSDLACTHPTVRGTLGEADSTTAATFLQTRRKGCERADVCVQLHFARERPDDDVVSRLYRQRQFVNISPGREITRCVEFRVPSASCVTFCLLANGCRKSPKTRSAKMSCGETLEIDSRAVNVIPRNSRACKKKKYPRAFYLHLVGDQIRPICISFLLETMTPNHLFI